MVALCKTRGPPPMVREELSPSSRNPMRHDHYRSVSVERLNVFRNVFDFCLRFLETHTQQSTIPGVYNKKIKTRISGINFSTKLTQTLSISVGLRRRFLALSTICSEVVKL